MILNWILLVVGMVLLIKGADYFVDGSSKIAKAMHIPSLIIGLTLVSMGTSAPELSVSLTASLSGSNDLSFGNVIGSNIFNTFLILGIASIFIPLVINQDMKKYDIPIMVLLYIVMILFGIVITPYKLDFIESLILIVLFIGYILLLILRARKSKTESNEENIEEPLTIKKVVLGLLIALAGVFSILGYTIVAVVLTVIFILLMVIKLFNKKNINSGKANIIINIFFTIAGLVAIIGGGDIVVESASNIAKELGMSEALVGLTIVAVGTSLPELVTSIVASIKKENDIAIGNVIGSNIFNIIFILGVSSSISTIEISQTKSFGISESLFDLLVLVISGVLVFLISRFSKNIKKWQGIIFVLLYVSYVAFIIFREFA